MTDYVIKNIFDAAQNTERYEIRKLLFLFAHAISVVAVIAIAGCGSFSSDRKSEHGFNVINVGAEKIMDVTIRYGEIEQKFCVPYCVPRNGGGGGWFASMPIQDEMFVTWKTADSRMHAATILVKEKLISPDRLRSVMLYFDEDHLTVLQALEQKERGAVGFEKFPLYKK